MEVLSRVYPCHLFICLQRIKQFFFGTLRMLDTWDTYAPLWQLNKLWLDDFSWIHHFAWLSQFLCNMLLSPLFTFSSAAEMACSLFPCFWSVIASRCTAPPPSTLPPTMPPFCFLKVLNNNRSLCLTLCIRRQVWCVSLSLSLDCIVSEYTRGWTGLVFQKLYASTHLIYSGTVLWRMNRLASLGLPLKFRIKFSRLPRSDHHASSTACFI